MFLTTDELRELTDRARIKDQIAWLEASGVKHWISAAGRPKVPKSAIEGGSEGAEPWTPNFSQLGL